MEGLIEKDESNNEKTNGSKPRKRYRRFIKWIGSPLRMVVSNVLRGMFRSAGKMFSHFLNLSFVSFNI